MNGFKIYLAGPISGLTYEEADGYFDDVREKLEKQKFTILVPIVKNEYNFDAYEKDKPIRRK